MTRATGSNSAHLLAWAQSQRRIRRSLKSLSRFVAPLDDIAAAPMQPIPTTFYAYAAPRIPLRSDPAKRRAVKGRRLGLGVDGPPPRKAGRPTGRRRRPTEATGANVRKVRELRTVRRRGEI